MPLILTITDAGRAALINAQNTGSTALTIAEIGVSDQAIPGDLTQLVTLPAELKRLDTFAGDVVADDTFHVTMRDESADTYQLRAFGLYFHTGVLFCVCSQSDVIVEKSPAAMALLAVDIKLAELTTELIEFGDTNFLNPAATTDRPGVIEIATAGETAAGADHTRAVSPWGLKQLLDVIVAGLAPLAHSHDASHTISGVFNVGRIPALDMSKITGLATALAARVLNTVQVIAGDGLTGGGDLTTSRTISMGAPATITGASQNQLTADGHAHELDIGIADIPQLQNELDARAGKAGDVTAWNEVANTGLYFGAATATDQPDAYAGVVQIARGGSRKAQFAMPTNSGLPRAWVRSQGSAGWSEWAQVWTTFNFDPATKANAVHSHDAGSVISGVFAVDRIPALPQSRVDGLVSDLAGKASLSGADFGSNSVSASITHTGGYFVIRPFDALRDDGSYIRCFWDGPAGRINFSRNGADGLSPRLWLSGRGFVWDQSTFSPDTKADLASPALTGNPTAPTQSVGDNSTRVATTAYADRAAQLAAEAALPPGTIAHYATATAPAGWLPCNGAAVSRSTYSALFAKIGTTHGSGNGSSTFNVPDLRGEFIRGLDSGRGVDANRVIGSWQADEFRSHSHGLSSHNGGITEMESLTDTAGDDERFNSSNRTMAEGGAETRPRNVALLPCIKF